MEDKQTVIVTGVVATVETTESTSPVDSSWYGITLPVGHQSQDENYDPKAGRGIGITILVLTIISLGGSACALFVGGILGSAALSCDVITIILASCIVGKCCCTRDYRLAPNRRKCIILILTFTCFQFATMLTLLLTYLLWFEFWAYYDVGVIIVGSLDMICRIINIVFASLFICDHCCCHNGDKK